MSPTKISYRNLKKKNKENLENQKLYGHFIFLLELENIIKMNTIEIYNAHLHNLKNIDISLPKNKIVTATGVSGSGKTTLFFDIILIVITSNAQLGRWINPSYIINKLIN
ncbi:MAG: hypothetical protein KGD58_01055 [Candidatus Lokiarchaeota archaeon]|nr:hypothetical protein [Candidatus Lokiarchaeota archaeon]